jgi:hypothetical protein
MPYFAVHDGIRQRGCDRNTLSSLLINYVKFTEAKLLRLRLYNTEALGPKKQQAKSYEREPAKLVDREPRSARRKRLSSDTSCA